MIDNIYKINVIGFHVEEDDLLPQVLPDVVDHGEDYSPFRRKLKRTKWFYDWKSDDSGDTEAFYIYDSNIKSETQIEYFSYRMQMRFESAFKAEDVDSLYFYYSYGQQFFSTIRRSNGASIAPALYGSRIEEGSILIEVFAAVGVIGGAIIKYPDLKAGLLELIGDLATAKRWVENSLAKSTERPLRDRREPNLSLPHQVNRQTPYLSQRDKELKRDLSKNRGGWNV